jgi:hypothetical protein
MTKGYDMGCFLLGFMMGLLAAIGLFGFLTYWLCSRSNNIAAAKFINGIAQALAHQPKSPEPLTPGGNGGATDEAKGTRKEKARER